jgi:hypothetical protein
MLKNVSNFVAKLFLPASETISRDNIIKGFGAQSAPAHSPALSLYEPEQQAMQEFRLN